MGRDAGILSLLAILLVRFFCVASLDRTSIDESSLLALKAHMDLDNNLFGNWSQATSFCSWSGVVCSKRHPRVTALNLASMGLRGTVAKEIGNLSFLQVLDINNNSIHGEVPAEIGNLKRLRLLTMSLNQLSGRIPKTLSSCVRLTAIDMSRNALTGNIPVELGNLSSLEVLVFTNNQLEGELPSTIFNISSLIGVDVGANRMSGSIPEEICSQTARVLKYLMIDNNQFGGNILSTITRCQSLQVLSANKNKFTGDFPNDIWNLSAVHVLYFSSNGFTGTIPASIGNLSNLVQFNAQDNNLYGTIPWEIGQLFSLTMLVLNKNQLNGGVPPSLFNHSILTILELESNSLSGFLPYSVGFQLPSLESLALDNNKFFGKIPSFVSNMSRMKTLDLSGNSFSGYIPITLGNLTQLHRLSLGNNQFTNNVSKSEQDFLSSLKDCKDLKAINIEFNPITGVLPKCIGSTNLSASLQKFTAQSCRIVSSLPDEIGNLSKLIWLDLGYNDLTGSIPTALGKLSNLQSLDLYGNNLQGSIIDFLCNLSNVFHVDLRENRFMGRIPGCLGSFPMLREINFANNGFDSSIPSTFWSNGLIQKMNFSFNFIHGSLSRRIGGMKSLTELDLSRNQISGEIPDSISELQILQYLDLSQNKLSGSIPKSLEALVVLTYFNVSFNNLVGEIPNGGPFANFTDEMFAGNKGLCGAPRFNVKACESSTLNKSKLLKYVLPATAFVFLAAIFLILIILRSRFGKVSLFVKSDLLVGLMHKRISYHEVLLATNSLDEENLIGGGSFGSVYKGKFSNGIILAIKVFNLDVQGALKSFDTECQMMCNIRHRNLVKVITSCSNLDFKALIMAYMSNDNLEKLLYSAKCSLNIFQRLELVIDVASAVEYLHHSLTFPVVHCDLKPSNILLDEDMVAHVGDFGIAKLFTHAQRMQQTRTLGTIGYMAPEYGTNGLISTKVDVYSYGILLMEIFSKRKPTDEMFSGELTMKRWVSESFPSSIMQIVDQELLQMKDESGRARHENCLTSIMDVAIDCTMELPDDRPNMKDVLARINKIKLNLSKCHS